VATTMSFSPRRSSSRKASAMSGCVARLGLRGLPTVEHPLYVIVTTAKAVSADRFGAVVGDALSVADYDHAAMGLNLHQTLRGRTVEWGVWKLGHEVRRQISLRPR